ncbi:hypothetical protein FPCIR_7948 [Fusarium pseudocircinatum]|uniref:Uncharacterized protein n=1 Tax=Fusarium pseudocircinatum TaxID=56676 RepID=A0A8H5L7R2_9HYPO|nr:hypothetical protein FPCIR_7948 [Fusarium pseudocircinatum]
MSEMILQATFAQKPRHSPDLLGDADRLQAACGKECQVDIIANNLRVTMASTNVVSESKCRPWGAGPPISVKPYSIGSGGVFQASAVPWVGSAGISGYTIANPAVWIGMLGSNPDWSADDNRARVAMSTSPLTINKDLYNNMYSANATSLTLPTANGHINLSCSISSADEAAASFLLTFDRGTGVTDEALGVVVPEEK